jgi:hypothetical protein
MSIAWPVPPELDDVASPILLMHPVTLVSPDWYFVGVRPKWAPTVFNEQNRPGSSTAAANVRATMTPTPGTVMSSCARLSSRA